MPDPSSLFAGKPGALESLADCPDLLYDIDNQNWVFIKAAMYAWTLGTTIGYGTITCETWLGKLFTIIYAVVAIPLFMWSLTLFIEMSRGSMHHLVRIWKASQKMRQEYGLHCRYKGMSDVGVTVGAASMVWAAVFVYHKIFWEPGEDVRFSTKIPSHFDIIYYLFISFTTIGLGDFSPGVESRYHLTRRLTDSHSYVGITCIIQMWFLTLGMAVTGAVFTLGADAAKRYY